MRPSLGRLGCGGAESVPNGVCRIYTHGVCRICAQGVACDLVLTEGVNENYPMWGLGWPG